MPLPKHTPTVIQATGAHVGEGMDPTQLLAFFERATNANLRISKESLEKIVQAVDEDGDGLVRIGRQKIMNIRHADLWWNHV